MTVALPQRSAFFACVGGENTEGGNSPKVVSGFSRAEKKVVEGKSLVAFLFLLQVV
jgi:hypothetical protein